MPFLPRLTRLQILLLLLALLFAGIIIVIAFLSNAFSPAASPPTLPREPARSLAN